MSSDSSHSPQHAPLTGFVVLDKPPGWTSRDAVNRLVSILGRKTRAGHAGTLDPLATGVLVVGLGAATRLVSYVGDMAKTYRAVIRLGGRSTTDDADGEVTPVAVLQPPAKDRVAELLALQVGTISQLPPRFSALKLAGRRAHELARAGAEVRLEPRPVRIDRIDIQEYEYPELRIEVDCGSGTYIRSIARDLGEALGCGGYIQELRRTRIGTYEVAQGVDPRTMTAASIREQVRPAVEAVARLPVGRLDTVQVRLIAQGRALDAARVEWPNALPGPGVVCLLDPAGDLAALGRLDAAQREVAPTVVLARPGPA